MYRLSSAEHHRVADGGYSVICAAEVASVQAGSLGRSYVLVFCEPQLNWVFMVSGGQPRFRVLTLPHYEPGQARQRPRGCGDRLRVK